MKCPSCNSENSESAKFCKKCGNPLNGSSINHQDMIDSMSNESKNNNTKIIIVALVVIAIVLAGAFAYVSLNNSSHQQSDAQAGNSKTPQQSSQQQPSQQQADTPRVSSDAQSSSGSANAQPSTSSMKILSGSFSTGSAEEDKTYASLYVGKQYAGQSVIVQIYYSRDGNTLNNGNMVPATVHSDGYLEIASADAYHYYPDHAQVNLYDSNSRLLDSVSVNLTPTSGTQTF